MEIKFTYSQLIRMTKKRVIRIAGYRNVKEMIKDGVGRTITEFGVTQDKLSKKYIARIIASDR